MKSLKNCQLTCNLKGESKKQIKQSRLSNEEADARVTYMIRRKMEDMVGKRIVVTKELNQKDNTGDTFRSELFVFTREELEDFKEEIIYNHKMKGNRE